MATVTSAFIMVLFLTLSQVFWLNTTLNIANGTKDIKTISTVGIIIAIPIIVILIGNLLFKTQDVK